ncbi:MAG: DNA-3-methyladenine glycosylase 2 family protein [Gemmatimonadetes bacterium]|nr:MAG: DNA-3-methyladenine glycosylase 2 family protein [Gemmatimonadota bacterium]PYO77241.1 MAG: DNA-3-methyladenine glycosylase 2 family protein [Gemmatimonadota bacterium]
MKSAGSSPFGRKAVAHLKKVDPVLAQVIDRIGAYRGWPASNGSHFDAVCRSIVFQQLSGKAAGTIHGRFQGLYGGRAPLPDELATTSDEKLRAVGLSRQKSAYLKDLGGKVAAGELPIETLHELTDEEVITALTQVKGIGRWTAQMFLMFRLGRPDVLPDLDLGVQKGIQRAYRLRKLPTPERVKKIGANWAPYRTVGSWYMWRLMDAPTPVPRSGGGGGRGGGG